MEIEMQILKALESIRTPILDTIMRGISFLGEETVFMVLAIVMFWCVDKWRGYYILSVGFVGTLCSQFMKLLFRVPRPWVRDSSFHTVDTPKKIGATGFSFPSGHTQGATGTFLSVGRDSKRVWLRIVCLILPLLVGFSRMYLGAHYPSDVGVGLLMGVILTVALHPILKKAKQSPIFMFGFLSVLILLCLGYLAYLLWAKFPPEVFIIEQGSETSNYDDGLKNGYTLLGCVFGLLLSYAVDLKKLHFVEKAPFWGQVCKVVLGLAGIMAIRFGLSMLFASKILPIFADQFWWRAPRYFCMVVFAGAIWPMSFPLWQKVGAKKR